MNRLGSLLFYALLSWRRGISVETSQILPNDDDFSDESASFIFNEVLVTSAKKVALHYAEAHVDDLVKILLTAYVPVTINAREKPYSKEEIDTRTPSDVVVISGTPATNMSKYLEGNIWTRDTRFILNFRGCRISEGDLVEKFTSFWMENIMNVVAVVFLPETKEIYGYVPYSEGRCNKVRLIKTEDAFDRTKLPQNQVMSFHGCILNASVIDLPPMVIFADDKSQAGTFHLEGTEISIIREVSKKMNFTPWYAKPKDGHPWGWIHPSPKGAVGEVYRKESHFGVGLLVTTLERFQYLDVSAPVSPLLECITIAVPLGAARKQPVWMEIYVNEFSFNLWLCIVATFGLTTLIFWALAKKYRDLTVSTVILFLFSTFLNEPVKAPNHRSLKCLFLFWIWYSFITVVSYQSLMKGRLTVPYRPREIETIRDFLDSNFPCMGYYNTIMFVTYKAEGEFKELSKRFRAVRFGMEEGFRRVLSERNVGYLREITSFKYYTLIHPQLKGSLHYLKQCVSEYYPIMVMQRNGPLTKPTNKIIRKLFESGILIKWRNRYIHDVLPMPPPATQLSIKHIVFPFIALLFGILLSTTAFLAEKYIYSPDQS